MRLTDGKSVPSSMRQPCAHISQSSILLAELRLSLIEKPFVRLFSLLAHHPDFESTNHEDLIAMSQYVPMHTFNLSSD